MCTFTGGAPGRSSAARDAVPNTRQTGSRLTHSCDYKKLRCCAAPPGRRSASAVVTAAACHSSLEPGVGHAPDRKRSTRAFTSSMGAGCRKSPGSIKPGARTRATAKLKTTLQQLLKLCPCVHPRPRPKQPGHAPYLQRRSQQRRTSISMDSMRSRSRRGAGPGGSTRRPPTGGRRGANAMLFHSTGQLARVCWTRVTWWCRASHRSGDGNRLARADDVIAASCSPVRGLMSLACAGPVSQVHTRRGAAQQPRAAAVCAALPRVAAPHAGLSAGLGARVRRSLRCTSAHAIMASSAYSSIAAAGATAVAEEACFTQRGYRRPLHWVFKVGDLQANLDFYAQTMGLKVRGGG